MAESLKHEQAALLRFAMYLTRSFQDAEDLAQDTMERALLKAHLFDGANLHSWLFTLCRRLFLNTVRKSKSQGAATTIDLAPAAAMRVESDQQEKLEFSEVLKCFNFLPAGDKIVLSMIAFDDVQYEAAARALNMPIGTIRSRVSRARARLRGLVLSGVGDAQVEAAA